VFADQRRFIRRLLGRDTVGPIHHEVDAETFSATGIEAMTPLYAGPEGHAVAARMRRVMERVARRRSRRCSPSCRTCRKR
jgi:hypothetical protein